MAPRRSVDDRLAEVEAAIADADDDALEGVVVGALGDNYFRIVALAARCAGERLIYASMPALIAAYPRFLEKPVKRDPNCLAKQAIIRALFELDCDDAEFYLQALRYRQMEPVWGGTVDTATDLRCSAAMGLVSCGYPRALVEVAELLTDSEAPVRGGAARAIACGNPREAELLLRAKVFAGDEDALVLADCFAGLLTVEPDDSPAFVARWLAAKDPAVAEAAALALGESRLPQAFVHLAEAWNEVVVDAGFRRVLIRAAALHRSDESYQWLLDLAAERSLAEVTEIVDVLAIYKHNEKLARRLRAALASRSDSDSLSYYEKVWI